MAIAEMTTEPNTGNPAAVVLLVGLGLVVVAGGLVWAATMRTTPDKFLVGIVAALAAAGLFGAASRCPQARSRTAHPTTRTS